MKNNVSIQEELERYFCQCENELVENLARLIAVKSVGEAALPGLPFGKGPAEALALGLQMAAEMGFVTRNYENYVGTVDLNGHETQLGILCHLDVVGEGTGWSTPPYTAVLKDGLLYGRGSSDDKGPAIAALYALKAVKDLGIPLRYNARLILGTDEENNCSDIVYYFEREPTPPYTFSPDGDFPVVNTEKGGLRPEFSQTWAPAAALPRLVSATGGYRLNVVPPQAEACLEGFTTAQLQPYCDAAAGRTGARFALVEEVHGQVKILVEGLSEHASTPEKGCNAITALLDLLAALPLAKSDCRSAIHALHNFFPHGDYYGNALGIAQADEISGPLTVSFNLFEMSLVGFKARFDSRTALCATPANSEDVVRAHFERQGWSCEGHLSPPHHTPADSPFIKTLLAAYEKYTGLPGGCESTGGGTYVHHIEGGVSFGASMPGFVANIHGPDERVSISELITAAKIFAQVIVDMCA